MTMATESEPATAAATGWIGWGLWQGKTFCGSAVHPTREDLLVGYDFMALQGLAACEERLLMHGQEVGRTEVAIGGKRSKALYSITVGGRIVPEALSWSCLASDPARTLSSAACLVASHPEQVGVEPNELEVDAMNRFTVFGKKATKREQAMRETLRERVLSAFQRLGIEVVPVALKRLPTTPLIEPFRCPQGWTLKKRFKVELDDLIDPWRHPHFQDLEVFAALARTTWKPEDGDSGPFELLSRSSCVNSSSITPLTGKGWRDELQRRFQHILLHRGGGHAQRWKDANGIALGQSYLVNWPTAERDTTDFPHWHRLVGGAEQVDRLLGEHGWLAWSLNECWPHAIRIQAVKLHFGPGGAWVSLDYGHPPGSDSGSGCWHVSLTHQRPGEPLIFMIQRAQARLDALKDPHAEPPRRGLKGEEAAPPASAARSEHAEWDPAKWVEEFRWKAEYPWRDDNDHHRSDRRDDH